MKEKGGEEGGTGGRRKKNHTEKAQAIRGTALSRNIALRVMFPPKLGPAGFEKDTDRESAPPWPEGCGSRRDSPLAAARATLLRCTFGHQKRWVLEVAQGKVEEVG